MELIRTLAPPSVTTSDGTLRRALATLGRFTQGLLATGLVEDVRERGPFTLLAPVDEAFDTLPWRFEDLLLTQDLLDERFDLFEYHVVRGLADAGGPRASWSTLHGELVRIGRGLVLGRYGASRILRTVTSESLRVHVLEQCIFPVFPKRSGSGRPR